MGHVWSAPSVGLMVAPPGVEDPDALASAVHAGLAGLWWPDHWMGWAPTALWETPHAVSAEWPHPDLFSDPFVEMAILGDRTGCPILGTAVTDAVRRHPMGLMQAAETVLRWLPDAEVVLGIGSGEGANLTPFGLERASLDKTRETLDLLRRARDLERVDHVGRWWELRAATPTPASEGRLHFWLGAHGPRMRRLAAQGAEGWLPVGFSPRRMQSLLRAERPDRPGWCAAVCVPAVVLGDGLTLDAVRESRLLRSLALSWAPAAFAKVGAEHPMGADYDPLGMLIPGHLDRATLDRLLDAVEPDVVTSAITCGSTEDLAGLVADHHDAGVDHVVIWELSIAVAPERRSRAVEQISEVCRVARAAAATRQ